MTIRPAILLPAVLAACVQFPDVDARISEDAKRAPTPRLIPLDAVLTEADRGSFAIDTAGKALEARAAALRARAARLRQVN